MNEMHDGFAKLLKVKLSQQDFNIWNSEIE